MENIGERLKHLRKNVLGLTQEKFCRYLYLSQSQYTAIENCKSPITDRTIADICREFNVNEEWLRNGTGEILIERPTDTIDKLCEEYNISALMRNVLITYTQLSDEGKLHVEDFIQSVVDKSQPTFLPDDTNKKN